MENRQGKPAPRLPRKQHFPSTIFVVAFACALLYVLSGCASPAEPIERKPPVPQPVTDLAVEQVGDTVALTFTVPTEALDHRSLDQPLTVEIFRDFAPASAAPTALGTAKVAPAASPAAAPLVTIPSAVASTYVTQGRFRYIHIWKAEDFSQQRDSIALYVVRTRASQKKESAPSNIATLRMYLLPDPIDDLQTEVTHSGIQLNWIPPAKTLVGPSPPIALYRIYRAESQAAATQGSNAHAAVAQTIAPSAGASLIRIAETQSPNYLDARIQFGNTYTYSVRSVVQIEGHDLESSDSNRITVLARDTFPPAAPQGLLVIFVPTQTAEPAHLELSWEISAETDLAGYNVYRSEQVGVQGAPLNTQLLPTPAFQDMNAMPGHTYFYRVTAVDRSDNESPAGAEVSGTVPTESQPTP
jgi:hypothetical protein